MWHYISFWFYMHFLSHNCSSDFTRNLPLQSYNCFCPSGSIITSLMRDRGYSFWLPCSLFMPPLSFVLCLFSPFCFVLFICPNSLWHYLTHFCSFPHPQYLTELEEKIQKLCIHFLQKKIFRAWFNMVREAKIDSQSKHKIAAGHSDRWGFDLWGNSLTDFTIALQHLLCPEHVWKDEVEAGRAGHSETPGRGRSCSSAPDHVGLQVPIFERRRMPPSLPYRLAWQ